MVSTTPLSEHIHEREAELAEAGVHTARERMTHPENSVSWIRWVGKSRFRSTAKEGDSIIELERNKQKTRCRVIQPRPILLRQDHGTWTRFYLDDPPEYTYFSWRQFIAEIKDSGVKRITMNTTRELTPREIAIMELLWRGE